MRQVMILVAVAMGAGMAWGQEKGDLSALAGEADLIVAAETTQLSSKPGMIYRVKKVLKGDNVEEGPLPWGGVIDWEKGMEVPEGYLTQSILFLRADGNGVAKPVVKPVRMTGWFVTDSEEMEKKVREAIPLPTEWGKEVNGLVMGVRLRKAEFAPRDEVAVEICIKNVGKNEVTIPQHRMNIYDYYPSTRFELDAGGSLWEAAKRVTGRLEADTPLRRTLKPGEVYIHTVRLEKWPVKETAVRDLHAWKATTAGEVFANVEETGVKCRYEVKGNAAFKDMWEGTLESNVVRVKAGKREEAAWGEAVGELNAQIERFNENRNRPGPPDMGVSPIRQRVQRVALDEKTGELRCYDEKDAVFLTLQKQKDGQFKGTMRVPFHQLANAERHEWGEVLAEFVFPEAKDAPAWGEAVKGLRCGVRMVEEKVGFGKGIAVEMTLENATDKAIDVVGPATGANREGECYPCPYVTIKDEKGNIRGQSWEDAQAVPTVVRIEPGESWTITLRLAGDEAFKAGEMPDEHLYTPGKYTVSAQYDARKERLQGYRNKGIKLGRVWEGVATSGKTTFEVTEDESEQLKILRKVLTGEGVKENLELILTVKEATDNPKAPGTLKLTAHNTGKETMYLGTSYGLHIKDAKRDYTDWGGLRGGVRAIEPGKMVELGVWAWEATGEKCQYWIEYRRGDQRKRIEVLKRSNVVTIDGAGKIVSVGESKGVKELRIEHTDGEPGERNAPLIAEVEWMEQLEEAKPIQLENGWEVRLGISDGGNDAGPWKLLYCLARYTGKDEGAGFESMEDSLGPVMFTVNRAINVNGERRQRKGATITPGKEALYCAKIMTAWKGFYAIRVYDFKQKLLAVRYIEVKEPEPCYWQTLTNQWGTVSELRQAGEPWEIGKRSFAAAPEYYGWRAIWTPTDKVKVAEGAVTPLPGKIDVRSPWNALYMTKEGGKEGEAGPPLRLTLEKDVLVVRSDVAIVRNADEHLLARWWVNGKAVAAARTDEVEMAGGMERLERGKEMRFSLGLPAALGEVKAGDRVGIQVLYSPKPFEQVIETRGKVLEKLRKSVADVGAVPPLVSNRVEFVVTEKMVKPRAGAGDEKK